jgi:hypothetical protein
MDGNFKILFLSLTLALFLAPGISLACSKPEKQVIKTATSSQTFIKQSFAQIQPSCDSDDCKEECCHPKSHNCQTDGCSGKCSGNLCSTAQYTILADSKFLEDSKNEASGYDDKNSNFFYQNPHYSGGFHTIWEPPKIG